MSHPEPTAFEDTTSTADAAAYDGSAEDEASLVDDEALVEEVSIDGMCGVY